MRTEDGSVLHAVDAVASRSPDRTWLRAVSGETLTYGEAADEGRRWADAFRRIGVSRGDHVLAMFHHTIDSLLCWTGLSWLGAVEAPVNTDYRGTLLAHAFRLTEARTAVVLAEFLPRLVEISDDIPDLDQVIVLDRDDVSDLESPWTLIGRADLLAGAEPDAELTHPLPSDIGCVLFTSGTTGPSKAVRLPWGQLHCMASGFLQIDDFVDDDVLYSAGPTYHVGGKTFPLTAAYRAISVVIRPYLSVTEYPTDIVRFGVTVAAPLPQAVIEAAEATTGEKCRLRFGVVPYKVPGIDALKEAIGMRTMGCFNMTEVSVPIVDPDWDTAVYDAEGRLSCGMVRRGYPGYEARIVDENDQPVDPGTVGELVVRTSAPWTLNAGYLNMPDATAEAWRNGWFHTGDAMYCDADGHYYFMDRMKDCIRRKSENISSFDVESYINEHPAVAVSAAVAVKERDEAGAEEEVKIVVQLLPDGELTGAELIDWAIGRMPRFMIPRYVQFVDEMPLTPTQKIRKVVFRDQGVTETTFDRVAAGISLPRT